MDLCSLLDNLIRASYTAIKTAIKLAMPRADSQLYSSIALAITFPFEINIDISLYLFTIGNC